VVIPLAPTNLSAVAVDTTQVNLTWTDNSTNEAGYKVQRKIAGGIFADVASTAADMSIYSDFGLTSNTTYTYRVYAYNSAGNSLQYSNEVTITTNRSTSLSSLTTTAISSIDNTSAMSGGIVTSDGGSAITFRGVCWSTSANPTIALSTKTVDGTGTGSFTSSMTGLTPNTTYHVRAYATNSVGTAYGSDIEFTTSNVTNLPSVTIGNQIWTSQNLSLLRYRNGDTIPNITDPAEWANLTTGAYCNYNNDEFNAPIYGRLYNWYAVNDPRGLAPTGWHVASDAEWNKLVKYIDPTADTTCQSCYQSTTAGGKIKETGTSHWASPNTGATNSNGFTGLPGGSRNNVGTFGNIGNVGYYWSFTDDNNAWNRSLDYNYSGLFRSIGGKANGFSVRLIRD
jgi:uncharacterized protein (TIGR02145 family)